MPYQVAQFVKEFAKDGHCTKTLPHLLFFTLFWDRVPYHSITEDKLVHWNPVLSELPIYPGIQILDRRKEAKIMYPQCVHKERCPCANMQRKSSTILQKVHMKNLSSQKQCTVADSIIIFTKKHSGITHILLKDAIGEFVVKSRPPSQCLRIESPRVREHQK